MKHGLLLMLLCVVNVGFAQQRILTREAQALGKGMVQVGLGTEFLSKEKSPFPAAPKTLWRIPTLTAYVGVSDNVNFEIAWTGRLNSTSDSNTHGSDWGDVTVGTLITLASENEDVPAFGIQTSVKLPSTTYHPHFLGSDQTDFYFSIHGAKHFSGIEPRVNLRLGIIGSPREVGSQDDIYIFSTAILFPLFVHGGMFIEGYGFTGYRDDDDKLLVRSGVTFWNTVFDVNIYGSMRVAGNNRDFGGAFSMSEDWSCGVMLIKEIKY